MAGDLDDHQSPGITQPAPTQKTATLEWAKVLVVPLSLGLITAIVAIWQTAQTNQQASASVSAGYVSLAVSLLQRPTPGEDAETEVKEADLALREWSVDVLVETSPVEIDQSLQSALRIGEVQVPEDIAALAAGLANLVQAQAQASAEFDSTIKSPGARAGTPTGVGVIEGPVSEGDALYRRIRSGEVQRCLPLEEGDCSLWEGPPWLVVGDDDLPAGVTDLLAANSVAGVARGGFTCG